MNILDNAKAIAELVKKYNDQELYQKIVDLRDEIFGLKEENLHLREQVQELEQTRKVDQSLTWESPYYWRTIDGKRDGPFCQKCYDAEKKLIRLQGSKGVWTCHQCKSTVTDSTYTRPQIHATRETWGHGL